jgi:hypothetical protein
MEFPITPLPADKTSKVRKQFQNGKVCWRGDRPGRRPADPGDLGVGKYYDTYKARAKCYGPVEQHVIVLKNPLVVSDQVAYDIIAERFMTCRGSTERRTVGAQAATRVLKCLGFDGVVAVSLTTPSIEVCVFPEEIR